MQFQFNSDYPGVGPDGSQVFVEPKAPHEFPPAQPIPCARITTRVFHPNRNQVATVQNVLVRTDTTAASPGNNNTTADNDNVSWSSDDMSSTSSDESMADPQQQQQQQQAQSTLSQQQSPLLQPSSSTFPHDNEVRAYWVQRTVREAIYGRVLFAVVLRRRTPTLAANDNAEWEVTNQHCAVKEMSWQHIRKERDRLAEDPIKEVSAMQFLKHWHALTRPLSASSSASLVPLSNNNINTTSLTASTVSTDSSSSSPVPLDGVLQSFQSILETNIMMPLDLLSDDRHLYSIMPYCDGGELFERLDLNERFTEAEARYWMFQILNVRTTIIVAPETNRALLPCRDATDRFSLLCFSSTQCVCFLSSFSIRNNSQKLACHDIDRGWRTCKMPALRIVI